MTISKDLDALVKWLEIREKNGYEFPSSLMQLICDMEHSALLQRLLNGKQPTEERPPKSFSYPNYGLVDTGISYPMTVFEDNHLGETSIVIDQSPWTLIEKLEEDSYVVQYEDNKQLYKVYCTGKRSNTLEFDSDSFSKLWALEKYYKE